MAASEADIDEQIRADATYRTFLSHFEQLHERALAGGFSISPDFLWLAITENCNLRCIGCFVEGRFKKIYVTLDEIRQLLVSAQRPYKTISLTEGEAFLHPQLCDIIELCREHHPEAQIMVISNGNVPIKGRYRQAVALIDDLGLSIDGATRETYEAIRKGANFNRFLANVAEICAVRKETGFPKRIGFSFTATRINLPELPGVIRLAHEFGVDQVWAQPMEITHAEVAARIADIHLDTMPRSEILAHMETAFAEAKKLKIPLYCNASLKPSTLRADPETGVDPIARELSIRMCQYPYGQPLQIVKVDDKFRVLACCYMDRDTTALAAERYGLEYVTMPRVDDVYNSPQFWRLRRDLAQGRLRDFCGNCQAAVNYPWKPPAPAARS